MKSLKEYIIECCDMELDTFMQEIPTKGDTTETIKKLEKKGAFDINKKDGKITFKVNLTNNAEGKDIQVTIDKNGEYSCNCK